MTDKTPRKPTDKTPQKDSNAEGRRRPFIVWILLGVIFFAIFKSFASSSNPVTVLSQRDFWERIDAGHKQALYQAQLAAEAAQATKETDTASTQKPQSTPPVATESTTPQVPVLIVNQTPAMLPAVVNAAVPKVKLIRKDDKTIVTGTWNPTQAEVQKDANAKGASFEVEFVSIMDLERRLVEKGVNFDVEHQSSWFKAILVSVLPLLIVFGLFYFLILRRTKGDDSPFTFGKSRAKMLNKEDAKIRFKDVAGVEEAKEEVAEIVEFLRDPKRFEALGGKVPKGVLLMGPPGTGKTLLAKAIAGESEVPFLSISGSDFVEMFVGVGASRVRDMFAQAKKSAPCILFIDEIDAIGRTRFTGIGGGHDEREQTLNAMLVEMDGFEGNSGVIVMAATNRVDVLDPALTRPGRFDRQIHVDLPTVDGRLAILKVHAEKVRLGADVSLERVARGTPGFSGAELANLLNEAALLAARRRGTAVSQDDLEEARDKVLWGRERRSYVMTDADKRCTAWHEGGHALAQLLLDNTEPLHKVTIIPRGRALGATMSLPERDVLNHTKDEMKDMLVVCAAGRVAEEMLTGKLSTGAAQDIKMATNVARRMVCSYGMSDTLGFQAFGENEEQVYLGREIGRRQSHSEATACAVDAEISKLLREAYQRAVDLLSANRDRLALLATYLMDVEVADGRDVEALVYSGIVPAITKKTETKMETTPQARVIAVDGPSGAGKSSVSKAVGQRMGFLHVDSGALYRIVTWQCLENNIDTSNPEAVATFAQTLQINYSAEDGHIVYEINGVRPDKELREPRINAHASPVATVPEVRKRITDDLRALTKFGDLIIEGRDITTAVFPDTPARFYLEADPAVRAARRQLEEVQKGVANQSVEDVKASLLARDKIDSSRACAPLRKADGVIAIDSTYMTLEEVIQSVVDQLPADWKSEEKKDETHA